MKSKKSTTPRTTEADKLRRVAEAKLGLLKKKTAPLRNTDAEFLRLIHELEVHQIELEMQNDELTQSRAEAEAARDQYTDLYDFAPVGYFTLTGDGNIQKTNLLGAKLLGAERGNLIGRRFGQFVVPESRSIFNAFLKKIFSTGANHESRELVLQKNGSDPVWVHLEAGMDWEQAVCRVAVVDISERNRAQDELRLSRDRLADLSRRLVETHEEEARAIGRELHDQIGQMLTALKLTLDILPHLPAELGAKKLAGAQELVDDLMNRVSALSLELRPPMLDDLGIIPALLWHINRFQEQSGVIIDFKHSGIKNRRFDFQIETTAYRIVQESLTNVARHAEATQVQIAVRALESWMEFRIEDNGKGFDPETALAKHRGLSAMRERVSLIGGNFQIESQLGKGTKNFIQLPLIVERAS